MGWKKSAKDGDLVASSIVSFQILPWICCKMNYFSLFYGKKNHQFRNMVYFCHTILKQIQSKT